MGTVVVLSRALTAAVPAFLCYIIAGGMHMAMQNLLAEPLTDQERKRAAMLANVVLDQARYKGFTIRELSCALKMVNLHLERGFGLKVSRWDENIID